MKRLTRLFLIMCITLFNILPVMTEAIEDTYKDDGNITMGERALSNGGIRLNTEYR